MYKFLRRLDKHTTASRLFVASAAVLLFFVLSNLKGIKGAVGDLYSYISPFVAGVVLAYLLNPMVVFFSERLLGRMKNRKAAHSIGVVLTLVIVFTLIVLLLRAVVPELITSSKKLVTDIDTYFDKAKNTLKDVESRFPFINIDIDETIGTWREVAESIISYISNWLTSNTEEILNASYQFGSGLLNVIITIAMTIYILFDNANVMRIVKRISKAVMPPERYEKASFFMRRSDEILKSYLIGNLLDSIIIGVVSFIFMVIFNMPSPGLISVVIGVTNYIPTFGPFIGAIPSAFLILLAEPSKTLIFIIFIFVLQQLDGSLIKPILFGDSTGLSPMWVLFSIIVFGRMFGFMGLLFGVPMFAILSMLVDHLLVKRYELAGIEDVYRPEERDEGRVNFIQKLLKKRPDKINDIFKKKK